MLRRLWFVPVLSFLFLCLFAGHLAAQNIRATILGTVHDESGAVMPGVKVTVAHVATGLVRTETTSDLGEFLFPLLPVGEYRLEAEKSGFKKFERSGIVLQVDDKQRMDVEMKVGQMNETVSVTESVPVVSTDSATVGNVVDNKKVTELPLNGRHFLQLNLLVPGVNQGVKGSQNQTQGGSISVNGAREQGNNFLLDGVDNNDQAINQYVVAISVEAVQEFKVQASTYSAEFGRSGGAQVNMATKSGTNEFHGAAYEFLRNAKMDAKNFFDKAGPIPPYKRNQFGASFGGPLRKDKTFFFGNYEGTRIRQAVTKVATVPTAAMKRGDFSALPGAQVGTDALGRPILRNQIFNPATLRTLSGGQAVRDPFSNNAIPSGMIDKVGAAVAALYPDPNLPLTGPASGQFVSSPSRSDNFNQFTTRIDHRFTDRDTLFGRYSFIKEDRFDTFDPFCAISNVPGFGCNTLNGGQHLALSYVRVFSPTKLNELRLGFNKVRGGIFQQNLGNDVSTKLGLAGTSRSSLDFGVPRIDVAGFDPVGEGGNLPQDRRDNTFEWADSFSWSRGSHALKFGGDVRRFQLNLLFDSNARGNVVFNPFYSSAAALNPAGTAVVPVANTGSSVADLLLGLPRTSTVSRSFAGITGNTVTGFRTTSVNLYAQDDWRVRPNLTLNLGLRWELNTPVTDKYNHLSTFDPSVSGFLRVTTKDARKLYNTNTHNFAPRVGFAYTPFGPKTVFRGGYGIFWDVKLLNIHLNPALAPPFLTPLNFFEGTDGKPTISLADPYGGRGTSPIPSATWLERNFPEGYMQQWSFNVQRQIAPSLGVTVGYLGSKGTHLDRAYNINAPKPSTAFVQANRPWPTFGAITVRSPSASSIYHSLQASAEKKFSKGLSFLAGYTWSKAIDDGSRWNDTVVNPFNLRGERGLSIFDTRHRFVASYTYDLPFGHGRQFLSDLPGWANQILGGWQTNGILALQSGNPIDVLVGLDLANIGGATRPDVSRNPNNFNHDPARWFDTDAFSRNFAGRFGNAGRTIVIGPDTRNFDFAMLKRFPLGGEARHLQFRAEIFNLVNHPNFDNPVTALVNASFGRVTSAGVQDPRLSSRQIQLGLRLVF